jgi:hypothetical protein
VIRTFLDAGVLITAFRSRNAASTPALTLLDDLERVCVTTDYVHLEVLPQPSSLGSRKPSYQKPSRKRAKLALRPWMRSMLPLPNVPAWRSSSPWSVRPSPCFASLD